jgi:hypothetical protein
LTLQTRGGKPLTSAVAGATLIGWIADEVSILPAETHFWIEAAYAGVGLSMFALGLSEALQRGGDS